jgi:type II secretion system protein I
MSARDARGARGSGPRRAAGQAGFTLIEVLVALVILSLAVVACIQGFAQSLRLLKLSGDHQQAMLLADQKVREVVDPREGQEESVEGPFRWERITRTVETPDLVPQTGPPLWRMFEIDVSVSWEPRHQVQISTLRMVPMEAVTLPPSAGATPSRGTPAQGTPGAGAGRQPAGGRFGLGGAGR